MKNSLRLTAVLFCFALAVSVSPSAYAITVPLNDGFVTDAAGVLTEGQKAELDSVLNEYRKTTSNEIAILLLKNLGGEPIEEVGLQVARSWGVGSKQNNNGLLILVALEERIIRMETGYGLEGAVPDVVSKGIGDQEMAPLFREGKYYEGLLAGIEALKKHIGGEYKADRYAEGDVFGMGPYALFLLFLVFQFLTAFLGKTSSWWLGGVLGGLFGVVLMFLYAWWVSIPILVLLGLLFDFIVSKMPKQSRFRRGRWWGGGFGGGTSGGSGGGFGGFGGGSFGGGGSTSRW